jgi:SAM-dependent methyltransferase
MPRRAPNPGGDQAYLRQVQYRDGAKLSDRAQLHVKYSTAPTAWYPWLGRQIRWPKAPRVLEVGCGTGWFWAEAAASLPEDLDLTLTDLSAGMVGEALHRVGGRGWHRRVVGLVADAQRLPHPPEQFDVVVANHMLYHVPEPRLAVGEMARVLRPDGIVLIATTGRDHLRELWQIRNAVFGRESSRWYSSVFEIDNGGEMLREQFAIVNWQPYEDRLLCQDPQDVLTFLKSCPPAESADAPQLDRLARAVYDRFADGDGTLGVTKETGVFTCRAPRPKA